MAKQEYKMVRVRAEQYDRIKQSVDKSGLKILTYVEQAIEAKLAADKLKK